MAACHFLADEIAIPFLRRAVTASARRANLDAVASMDAYASALGKMFEQFRLLALAQDE